MSTDFLSGMVVGLACVLVGVLIGLGIAWFLEGRDDERLPRGPGGKKWRWESIGGEESREFDNVEDLVEWLHRRDAG